jgi:hypothetical protein
MQNSRLLEDYRKAVDQIIWLRARVAELESGLIDLLQSRPSGPECNDFCPDKKDSPEGFDCTCKDRWGVAVEIANNLLKNRR